VQWTAHEARLRRARCCDAAGSPRRLYRRRPPPLQFRIPLEQPAFQLRWFFKQHRQDLRRWTALVQRHWTSYAHSTYGRVTR
jgi:hypothetical protein